MKAHLSILPHTMKKTLGKSKHQIDYNGDNYIDYIKVVDYVEKNVHYIILQVAVSQSENQDVAVFVVRKDPDDKVVIQLVGDEALYGKYYIVEPFYGNETSSTPNPGYMGNTSSTQTVVVQQTTTFQYDAWPLIQFIFLPSYIAWHSPWYYGYYPNYWRPWTPWYWHQYYGYHYYWQNEYYGHYHNGHHNGYDNNWHDVYYGHHRTISNTVHARRERGAYNSSYSKPESIRDGSDYFRKQNPGKAGSDIKDPEVRNIRVASAQNSKTDKVKNIENQGTRTNTKQPIERKASGRTESSKANARENNKSEATKNAPKMETPKKDAPKKDAPKRETPKKDAPKKEMPKASTPDSRNDKR